MIMLVDTCKRRTRVWDDGTSSPVKLERPRKRVRISLAEPCVHRYDVPASSGTSMATGKNGAQKTRKTHRTWLTREELAYLRSCAKKLCRKQQLDGPLREAYLHSNETSIGSKSTCIDSLAEDEAYVAQRGLERWSSSHHALVRSVKIVEVKTAVFLEQTAQFLSGEKNPSTLARVSQAASESAKQFARYLATVDTAIAMQVCDEKPTDS